MSRDVFYFLFVFFLFGWLYFFCLIKQLLSFCKFTYRSVSCFIASVKKQAYYIPYFIILGSSIVEGQSTSFKQYESLSLIFSEMNYIQG